MSDQTEKRSLFGRLLGRGGAKPGAQALVPPSPAGEHADAAPPVGPVDVAPPGPEAEPDLVAGHTTLVAAHGNSLRALAMHLEGLTPGEVLELNIPTGIPLVYELNDDLEPMRNYYLGDPEKAAQAAAAVAAQSRARA